MISRIIAVAVFVLSVFYTVELKAEEHIDLDTFSRKLDNIERNFWKIALLPPEHDLRGRFAGQISELRTLARQLQINCSNYKPDSDAVGAVGEKDKIRAYMNRNVDVPHMHSEVETLNRVLGMFRRDPKVKIGTIKLSGSSMRDYRRRHNKFMKEKDEESGSKKSSRSSKYREIPKLSKVDLTDYIDFLDEINSRNLDKFSSHMERLKSNSKIKNAEEMYSIYQKSVYNMRIKLVLLAKYATFKRR